MTTTIEFSMKRLTVNDLPPECESLGRFISATDSSEKNNVWLWVGGALVMAGLCLSMPLIRTPQPGEERQIWLAFGGGAAFFVCLALGMLALQFLSERHQYFLFDGGFVRYAKGRYQVVPWSLVEKLDVLEMHEYRFAKPTTYATITVRGMEKLSLNSKYKGGYAVIHGMMAKVPNTNFRRDSLG